MKRLLLGAALVAVIGMPAPAQILGPVGQVARGLPDVSQLAGRATDDVVSGSRDLAGQTLASADRLVQDRVQRLADFVRRNSRLVEADPAGDPVVRGEVLALAPTPAALDAARQAGFSVLRTSELGDLGIEAKVLGVPPGMSARDAVQRLRELDPAGAYDFDHLYFSSGEAGAAPVRTSGATPAPASSVRVGLIDTGFLTSLPVFAGVRIEIRGFAPGAPKPALHGAEAASLISGRLGGFRGAAPGASLYVADIYGSTPAGGSAEALAEALAWMAKIGAPVINISLVGPPNLVVGAAVRALNARGAKIVAAVGNDGPAAPPAYPASYPEVIAVTPVDARGRVLPEAGRALHVDFAAPGAGLVAANAAGGLSSVRGASFAAPIVAGRLASLLREPNPAAASEALAGLARQARPAGRAAGRGIIGDDVLAADRR